MTTSAPLNDADRDAERKRADRLLAESFAPGSTLRSPEFIDGFRARLYFSFAGDPITNPHPIGTAQADAFYSGIDYGRIVRLKTLSAALKEATANNKTDGPDAASVRRLPADYIGRLRETIGEELIRREFLPGQPSQ